MLLHCQNNNYVDWENPNNFTKHNLNNVSIYSYEVKKNGKVKKDSVLLRKYEYDRQKSTIKGINHNWLYINHGGGSKRLYYNFKYQFQNDSLLLKKTIGTILKEEKNRKKDIEHNTNVVEYKYNAQNRKEKTISFSESNSSFIYKKDTVLYSKSVYRPIITEYEYNYKNKLIKEFVTIDSSTYSLRFDASSDFSTSKDCSNCKEKYLAQEWKYENDKLIEWLTYTSGRIKHTKRNYFYDDDSNLIKQIDSTGWYFSSKKHFLDSTTEIIYTNNGKIITITKNKEKTSDSHYYKTVKYYNEEKNIVKREEHSNNQINIHEFIYENSNLKFEISKYCNNDVIHFEYFYNEKELIKEQMHFINNYLVAVEKYYYN